ncbi:MAG: GNAT family N-acetyltransferase [Lachnospiraceae bacterium]|nr:GNAT family N-acetyltransferase [Lachnospiraceae bacterium]
MGNMENRTFMLATKLDTEEVLKLYRSVVGSEYCAWTDSYPSMETIDYDLQRDALYVMRDESGEIIGAITVDDDPDVNALSCWSKDLQGEPELSRLVVRADHQNQGMACDMIYKLMEILRGKGHSGIRYMVSKRNIKAMRSYSKLHAVQVGEAALFGDEFWCFEKRL